MAGAPWPAADKVRVEQLIWQWPGPIDLNPPLDINAAVWTCGHVTKLLTRLATMPTRLATTTPGECRFPHETTHETTEILTEVPMQTLDEMLNRKLLTPLQHTEISVWITQARTPDAIRQMPAPLWRTLALASLLMNVDADLTQPPQLSAGP